jgi:hypothetical protein
VDLAFQNREVLAERGDVEHVSWPDDRRSLAGDAEPLVALRLELLGELRPS